MNICQTTQFKVACPSNIGDMCIHSKMTVQCKTVNFVIIEVVTVFYICGMKQYLRQSFIVAIFFAYSKYLDLGELTLINIYIYLSSNLGKNLKICILTKCKLLRMVLKIEI